MKTLLLRMVLIGLVGVTAARSATPPVVGPAPGKTIKVFLLAGQSNMEGKGDGAKLTADERAALKRAKTHVRLAYNRLPIGPLDAVAAGAGNKKRFEIDTSFGPELFFGLRLAAAWPDEPILLIKRSVGATSLHGVWNPEWTAEKAKHMGEERATPLFADFLAYVRDVLAPYRRDEYEYCGMLWVQGEADGNVGKFGPEPAAAYGRNLQNLITRVRQETGVPALPFLMIDVGAGQVVEGMKATVKALPAVSFIPQSKDPNSSHFFPKHAVGHYNYEGQKRMGSLLAEEFLRAYAAGR